MSTKPTISRLHEVLVCDPLAGRLFWLPRKVHRSQDETWNTRYSGKETFLVSGTKGYLIGKVDSCSLKKHHVIWAMVTGRWPKQQIDHKNGDPTDNRIYNLREVSQNENMLNQKAYSKRSGLPPGVNRNHKKFGARVQIDGVSRYLGSFDTPDEAHQVYLSALRDLGFSDRHGSS